MLAGNLGNQFRKQYSLTGSTVNIAARLEGLNKEYGSRFLVSGAVYEELAGSIRPAESLGDVRLRGIAQPITIYRLA